MDLEKENMEKKRKAAEEEEEEGTSDGRGPFSLRNKERKTNYLQQAIPDVMAMSGSLMIQETCSATKVSSR